MVTFFPAVLCTVRRASRRQTGTMPTAGQALDAMLEHQQRLDAAGEPGARGPPRVRAGRLALPPGAGVLVVPEPPRSPHRVSLGGGTDDLTNRTTLCAWHHLCGVHAGLVRCAGTAPDALRFELGVHDLLPPLLAFAPGERLAATAG